MNTYRYTVDNCTEIQTLSLEYIIPIMFLLSYHVVLT